MKHILAYCLLLLVPFISNGQNNIDSDLGKLEVFLSSIDKRYVDSVQTSSIIEKGMRSMLEELDPHSVYMNPAQYKSATEPLSGKFKGIGIRYQVIEDTLTVIEVLDKSPAKRGGVELADQIVAIGLDTLSGKSLKSGEMSKALKADENLDEPLTIIRQSKALQLTLERDNVLVSSVPSFFMMSENVGYLKLSRFSSTSLVDFRKALDALVKQGAENLVLDLRGNSGGYLSVAIKIVDEFIEDRKLIVYTEGVNQSRKETFATSGGRFTDGKLVVLIDENSASASEIVAGAIQDWDRGLIIGRRSYGKGLVQRTIEFEDGSAMRLTISRYYTPTGRSIQRPYEDGVKAYRKDLGARRKSGELYSQDSIKLNTSDVYFTPSRRKVYGGGGIVPDVFIPADSGQSNEFLKELNKSRLHYKLALDYALNHTDQLKASHPSVVDYTKNFDFSEDEMSGFFERLKEKGIESTETGFAQSEAELGKSLKRLVSRFHYGYRDYHFTMLYKDPALTRAMDSIESGTFEDLGLK
ncbi:MAG: S41 family peptidase [Flavobacteriales bacterium]|nr:S41 family peptidase [Flavobacteriales bacterium]